MLASLKETFSISKKSFIYLIHFPQLLLFPLCNVAVVVLIEMLFFYLFFLRYRIYILDPHTLEQWALVSLWEFSFFTLIVLGPLYFFFNFISQIIKVTIVHGIEQGLSGQKVTSFNNSWQALKKWSLIFDYNYLSTLVFLTSEPFIKRSLKNSMREMGAHPLVPHKSIETWRERTFVVIPLIALEQIGLKDAIKKSGDLMRATFGALPTAQFNFPLLTVTLCLVFGIIAERLTTYNSHQGLGIAVLCLTIGIIVVIVRILEAVFETATFFYCSHRPTGTFSTAAFNEAFKIDFPKSDDTICIHQDF